MDNRTEMRYPNEYTWLLFFSAMDIIMTWVILWNGGYEANPIARTVIEQFGLPGVVAFKFCLVLLVILVCEAVGARRPGTGRKLAVAAILVTCLPVALSFSLLWMGGA